MYLNLIQIAESFGVEEAVVQGWVREEGLPHTLDRGRILFDRGQVAEWAAKRGLAARAGFLAPRATVSGASPRLGQLLRVGGIIRDVKAEDYVSVLERVITALPGTTAPVRRMLGQKLRAPGGITMAPVGNGFALPHPSTRIALGRDAGTIALVLLGAGELLEDVGPDSSPITRLLFFIAPSPRAHLELLGQLSRSLIGGPFRSAIERSADDSTIYAAADTFDSGDEHAAQGGGGP